MGAGRSDIKGLEHGLDYTRMRLKDEAQHHHVSFSDILKHSRYTSWLSSCDKDGFNGVTTDVMNGENHVLVNYKKPKWDVMSEILFELGLDIEKPIQEDVCFHRNYSDAIVNTVRYSGSFRTDTAWVKWYRKEVMGVNI
jgi:hypothetical protein